MAAGEVVCPFFGVVFERLKSLIRKNQKELGPLVGMVEELKKLHRSFCKIKEVLNDAEEKQFKEEEESVRFWLQELNDAAYVADDVFDDFEYYGGLQQLASEEASSSNNAIQQICGKLQNLIVRFHDLTEECSRLDLQKEKEKITVISPDRRTISLLTEPQVYGREEERENLVKQLLGSAYSTLDQHCVRHNHPKASGRPLLNNANSSSNQIHVSVILGIGGLGKTTLAQMVYNDERVEKHFDFKCWVCISNDFDAKRILKEIVASFPNQPSASENLEELQKHFRKELSNKRFLLVLDDVWEERREAWNELKGLFRSGAEGSSIMVTTRLPTVASIAGILPPHCLHRLSEKDCWTLFKQYAFGPGNEERPALVEIGKKIVKKCEGLPLVAKALGCLLRYKNEENEWLSINDNAIWELPQSGENNILPALRLSYYHLQSHLRSCFVFCSIFPKDYQIDKEKLIQLWMANGLVQPQGRLELEDAGKEIFNALLWRSFFQDIEKDEDGNVKTCKMHDLVHDLACYIAADEYSIVGSSRECTKRTRHVLRDSGAITSSSIQRYSPCLRSLIQLAENDIVYPYVTEEPDIIFSNLIHLRALDLWGSAITEVPDSIGEMMHLRYLNLSYNWMNSLPESICKLSKLQTLKLIGCSGLKTLPKNMKKMSSLRDIDIRRCDALTSTPARIGKLYLLQTLSIFIVGVESGRALTELQDLDLGGELVIKGLQHVKNAREAKAANLTSKKKLRTLGLSWSDSNSQLKQNQEQNTTEKVMTWSNLYPQMQQQKEQQQQQNVIEGLRPHANVRKVIIGGYGGVTSPSWLTPSLVPNVVELHLSKCRRCENLQLKLPLLKVLWLSEMDSLKFVVEVEADTSVGGGFPLLEKLGFDDMPNLEGWSSSSPLLLSSQAAAIAVFPCLKTVYLNRCPQLRGVPLSWSPVQEVYMRKECNSMVLGSLQDLHCLPSLEIDGFIELESFPPGMLRNLTALQKLDIKYCTNLKALPVELASLVTLTELKIYKCRNLISLAEEGEGGLKKLSSLKTLEITGCLALKHLPQLDKTSLICLRIKECPEMEFLKEDFEHLLTLEELELVDLPKLTCFPEGIKHAAATLQRLEIGVCSENGAMELPDWIGTLTSLEYLSINSPMNWKVLPQWMQHLAALKTLYIFGCHEELEKLWEKERRRWKKENEEDEEYEKDEDYEEDGDDKEYEEDEQNEEYEEDGDDKEYEEDEQNEEYEEDEQDEEDNEYEEGEHREDYFFNMISHVPHVHISCTLLPNEWPWSDKQEMQKLMRLLI